MNETGTENEEIKTDGKLAGQGDHVAEFLCLFY